MPLIARTVSAPETPESGAGALGREAPLLLVSGANLVLELAVGRPLASTSVALLVRSRRG